MAKIFLLLQPRTSDSPISEFLKEFFVFGLKNALACIFPAFIFCMLILSRVIHIPFLPRYDFLLLACIAMQAFMYFRKMESGSELLVITMFHLIGIALEIYKVRMGSWSYPEAGYSKILGVPLYSGFMYASVGSFICQSWRWFDLKIENWPGKYWAALISLAIYANFFTHHYFIDLRWAITALLIGVFWKTKVLYNSNGIVRKMPMVLSFFFIGFFIWIAENMATFLGAWQYASQHKGWKMVGLGKISSWFLLIVLSIVIVVQLKRIKEWKNRTTN